MDNLGDIGSYLDENWHGGQIQGDFFDHPAMDIEEQPIQQVQKKPPQLWNWEHVITRQLMRGKHKAQILRKYQVVIDRFKLNEQVQSFLDKNDGLLGYFIVDVSNFDEKFGYEDIPQYMRDCNLFAYGATELREIIDRSLVSENNGTIDGFFNSDDTVDEKITYVDQYTGLPCIETLKSGDAPYDDDRYENIVNLFIGKRWMTESDKSKFYKSENRLNYLVNIVRKNFTQQSNATGDFEDDANVYNLQNQELQAVSEPQIKQADVDTGVELKVDDIGDIFENDLNDFDEIEDFALQGLQSEEQSQDQFDYYNDIEQNGQDFVLEQPMSDDFDYVDLNNNQVDLDEMFMDEAEKRQVEYEDTLDELDVSNDKETGIENVDIMEDNQPYDIEDQIDEKDYDEDVQVEEKPEQYEVSNKYQWNF